MLRHRMLHRQPPRQRQLAVGLSRRRSARLAIRGRCRPRQASTELTPKDRRAEEAHEAAGHPAPGALLPREAYFTDEDAAHDERLCDLAFPIR